LEKNSWGLGLGMMMTEKVYLRVPKTEKAIDSFFEHIFWS